MRRGDIVVVNLDPTLGAEANTKRPAVIVSNDAANDTAQRLGRGVVTVVPVTSTVHRVYPFQVLLPTSETGLSQDSKAQAEQVRSISVGRIGPRLGVVPPHLMRQLEGALRLHLDL